jgi:hypothetical protein
MDALNGVPAAAPSRLEALRWTHFNAALVETPTCKAPDHTQFERGHVQIKTRPGAGRNPVGALGLLFDTSNQEPNPAAPARGARLPSAVTSPRFSTQEGVGSANQLKGAPR